MSFAIIDAPQRSADWFAARAGRLTGSVAADMLATIKRGEAAARRDLRTRLVCERLTGRSAEDGSGFVSKEMQRGIDREPDALAAYEAATGAIVHRTGFLAHDTLALGCSLDGHVGDFAGIVEAKCPKAATHYDTLIAGVVPREHEPQITHNLFVSGAAWCDFISFDDRFPAPLHLIILRTYANARELQPYELAARLFLGEVEHAVETLRARIPA